MQRRNTVMALLAASSLFASAAYAAPPEGKGPNNKHSAEHRGQSGKGNSNKRQTTGDRDDHHRNNHHSNQGLLDSLVYAGITATRAREYARTAGFHGYSELPPGIRKNLMRGKPLPPGIAKKVRSGAFLDSLPRHPGYEWQTAGSELILVSIATGVIADILYDVFD